MMKDFQEYCKTRATWKNYLKLRKQKIEEENRLCFILTCCPLCVVPYISAFVSGFLSAFVKDLSCTCQLELIQVVKRKVVFYR